MRYGSKLRMSHWTQAALVLFCLLAALPAHAAETGPAPGDSVPELILSLAVILVGAKLGGHVAARVRQPPVLGELVIGVVLGNLTLFGFHGLDFLLTSASVAMLAELGVILLLFQVGLESTVAQMLKVGLSSFLVATLGVIGPFLLGVGVGVVLLPGESIYAQIFLGATLTATSVGITARVLKDLGRSQTGEARIILGAAVIDDVQGLIILAVVTGIIHAASIGTSLSMPAITLVVLKAAAFLIGALLIGTHMSPRMFAFASKLKSTGVLLSAGLSFCFFLAWLASRVGLAPIVGAFAAGLILEDLHYRDFVDRGEHSLEELVEPIASFLVPVFFVLMGMRTDLRAFTRPGVLGLAAGLTAAAIVGKQLCSLGVLGKEFDRLSIGIGMIPRGEVGLIFANIGLTLVIAGQPVVNPSVFAAVVVMVIVTTVITPPMLSWSFNRRGKRESVVARGAAAGN
jgi:Kef-type K+ transport system membrane component KefB